MKEQYSELFQSIIKAYYNGRFEEKIVELLDKEGIDKSHLASAISSLCGVGVSLSDNYIEELKHAIRDYDLDHKVVNKVRKCSIDCNIDKNGNTRCQDSCPFDAILVDEVKHTTYISSEKCTDCGFCVEGCPTGSILDRVEFIPLVNLLQGNPPVVAAVAPAIMGQYGDDVTIKQLRTALKKIGFTDMVEVAFFADMLTLKEAIEFDAHVKTKEDFMITSCCCPMWVAMLKRVYGDLVKHVSPTVSPMIASGRVLKHLNPTAKLVFIGPCVAKKAEIKEQDLLGDIDYVLTFSELKEIFEALEIDPSAQPETESVEYASRGGRLYARTGGVSIAIAECIERMFPEKQDLVNPVQANGVKECKEMLSALQKGVISGNFIEGMGCIGGCVGGPKAIIPRDKGREQVNKFAESSAIKVAYDSIVMNAMLDKLGIFTIDDYKEHEKTEIFHRDF